MGSIEMLLLETLAQATSQDVVQLKAAELLLNDWETKPGFYTTLLKICSEYKIDPTVRWMAALTFKNGVDRYWRKTAPNAINEEEKKELRENLLRTFGEPVNQVAVQLAVVVSKVARFDFPREWPELVPTLCNVVMNGEEQVAQQRGLLVLYYVIKTLASKRLAGDRRIFHDLTNHLYTFMHNLHNSTMETFFSQVQSNDPRCQSTLEKVLLTLRIMRKLTIHGFTHPKEDPQVVTFVESVFDRAKNMLQIRNKLVESGGRMVELIEKVSIHLTKILLSLLEMHPNSFLTFIRPSLSFCVSLLFSPDTDSLLFPRFIVQCLNIIKGVLVCEEYKVPKGEPRESLLPSAVQGSLIKSEFFQTDVLTQICTKLVTHYFLLSQEDLDLWESDPEGFVNEECGESWKYNLRPCTETLFTTLVRSYRDIMAPVLMQLLYANYQPVPPHDLSLVLRKDAIYLAVGLCAFDLFDDVDFDKWFPSLLQELTIKEGHYRIIRRRAAWLLGEWCIVRLGNELKPTLHRSLAPLLQSDEDMTVRLTAANALKRSIDDFEFDTVQFLDILEPTFGLLFNLLKDAKECDTKMHVLTVLSIVIERMGDSIKPYSDSLIQYLSHLWNESGNHNMLRCAIVSTLVHCVRFQALASDNLSTVLCPVVEVCVDITQEPHIYLLEDGLELWLTIIENSATLSPSMLNLFPKIPPIMERFSEHTQLCTMIIQAFILISSQQVFAEYGNLLFSSCLDLLTDLKPEGLVLIYAMVELSLSADPVNTLQLARPIIEDALLHIYHGSNSPMMITAVLSILSSLVLHSLTAFSQTVAVIAESKSETAEATLDKLLTMWIDRLPLVADKEKQKLNALALSSFLTVNSPVVHSHVGKIITCVVETLNDITDFSAADDPLDTLMWVRHNDESDNEIVTEHDRRMSNLSKTDPVYNIELRLYLKSQVEGLAKNIGVASVESIISSLDEDTLKEFKRFTS